MKLTLKDGLRFGFGWALGGYLLSIIAYVANDVLVRPIIHALLG